MTNLLAIFSWTGLRYAIAGTLVAGLYAGGFFVLSRVVRLDSALSSNLALAVAIVAQYFLHAIFTFRRDWRDRAQLARFVFTIASGLLVSQFVIGHLAPRFGLPDFIGLIVVMVVLPLTNLVFFFVWVFAQKT